MAHAPEASAAYQGSRATFLALRAFDHWMAFGATIASADSQVMCGARSAVSALTGDPELQAAIALILDAVTALRDPDPQPVLPRLYALASLLEQRGMLLRAGDIYALVARHADARAHLDLAYEAHMRHAYCLRQSGEFEWADQAYANAGMLATRDHDRTRVILSRLGRAKVIADRGNLPASQSAIEELRQEAEALGSAALRALVLHDRANLAWLRDDATSAIHYAFEAYRLSPDEYDRERILGDLALFLSQHGAFESARDALRLLEATARSQGSRWAAKINLMDLAARAGEEGAFDEHRRFLSAQPLPTLSRLSFLYCLGTGCLGFARFGEARTALAECARVARAHQINRRAHQAEEALEALADAERKDRRTPPTPNQQASVPTDIARTLRTLVRETPGTAP